MCEILLNINISKVPHIIIYGLLKNLLPEGKFQTLDSIHKSDTEKLKMKKWTSNNVQMHEALAWERRQPRGCQGQASEWETIFANCMSNSG